MMKRVPGQLTANARELRNNSTKAERLLWLRLRNYRPRFTRQLVVEPYIVNLACREAKLAIELDGSQHAENVEYDGRRTKFLEGRGWEVVRLWNNEVEANPDGAAEFVLTKCSERLGGATHPQPLPSREGRPRRSRFR
jgi:very-short-patch-repair endonuclease